MTSKSFRAQLPALAPDECERLSRLGVENCAASVLCREGSCVMWLVMRERARSREDHARSVRSTLRNLSIDLTNLRKGLWLTLACSEFVQAEISTQKQNLDSTIEVLPTVDTTLRMPSPPNMTGAVQEDEDKIITLTSCDRRTCSQTLAKTRGA